MGAPGSRWSLLGVTTLVAGALSACHDRSTSERSHVVDSQVTEVVTDADKTTHPSVAIRGDGKTVYVAWTIRESNPRASEEEDSGGTLYVSRSENGGRTFPRRVQVGPRGEVAHEGVELRVDATGVLFVLWAHVSRRPPADVRMQIARSTDGGNTFSPITEVFADPSPVVGFRPSLAVSGDGKTVLVSWLDLADPLETDERRPTPILVAVSRNGGAAFDPPVTANPSSCSCCDPALAMFRDHPALVWRGQERESADWDVRDTRVTVSSDDGRTWAPAVTVYPDRWRINACPVVGPAIFADANEGLHLAWYTGAEGRVGVWHALSRDARTFSVPMRLSPTPVAPSSGGITLGVDRGGTAWVAATDTATGEARVHLWEVPARGEPCEIRTASVPGTAPRIAVAGDHGALVWSDGNGKVLLRRFGSPG